MGFFFKKTLISTHPLYCYELDSYMVFNAPFDSSWLLDKATWRH
jgi:hypothetical protein